MLSLNEKIARARTVLLLDHPFYSALLYRLRLVRKPSLRTMATDGVSLFYNPEFVDQLPTNELVGVLAHEVVHPALKHHTRRGDRDPKVWNMACDYAINPILLDAGLQLPKDCLNDPRFRNMSAEAIYNLLDQQSDNSSSGSEQSGSEAVGSVDDAGEDAAKGKQNDARSVETPGGFGQVLDAPNPETGKAPATTEQKRAQEQAWDVAVKEAAVTSKMAGKLPAGVPRALEEAEKAQVDWREALRRTFCNTFPADYSWSRPNRRFIHAGFYLPGIQREGVGEIVIAVDCSGSISNRVLGFFQSEVNALIDEHRPSVVHVLYFDTMIHRHDSYQSGESIRLSPAGGGGTSFIPAFEWITDRGISPQSLIFLTDLDGDFPSDQPPYPVLWVSTCARHKAPFGEIIPIAAA